MTLQSLGDPLRLRRNEKYRELEELVKELELAREEGKKIVHCHGVFDLLHIGHIRHLKEAKKMGGVLVVTITPDHFVGKGTHRPAFSEDLRAEAVAALDCVDYVAINKWPLASDTIRLLKPDFYVKGQDYKDPRKDHTGGISLEEDAINSVGGKLVITEDISFSSSNLINRFLPVFPKAVKDYLEDFSSHYSIAH
jgi:rfaE bifunctional protein nucleotidyltransferase chain/domain